jgi:hypothetical protein
MTSWDEVAAAGELWTKHCQKVDSVEENALRDLKTSASSEATHADKLSLWSRSRYAST